MTHRLFGRSSSPTSTREAATFIALASIAPLFLSLIVTPYVVSTVGLRSYGFWAITGGLLAWVGLLDVGIGGAVQQRVAASSSSPQDVGRWVGTSLALATVLAMLPITLILIGLSATPIGWTRNLPEGWQLTVGLAGVALSLSFISSVPMGLLKGRSRWRVFSLTVASGQVIYSVTVVPLLSFGMGLPALSAALVAASFGVLLLSTLFAAAFDRESFRAMTVDRHSVKPLLQYGGNIQVSNLVQVANTQTDKLILVAFAPLSWIALFELGLRLALTLRNLALSVFPPMISRAASEGSGTSTDAVARFYQRQLHQTYRFVVCPLVGGLPMVFAFVFLWLGRGFQVSAGIAVMLTLGYSLNLMTGPGTSVARGAGRPAFDRNYSLVGFAVNILATVALGFLWGGWGVVAATVLGLASSSLLLLRWIDGWLHVDETTFSWRGYVRPARVELPALIAVSLAGVGLAYLLVDGRLSAVVFLAAGSAIAITSGAMHEVLRRYRRRALVRVTYSGGSK